MGRVSSLLGVLQGLRPKEALRWHCYFVGRRLDPGAPIVHFAKSSLGRFEVFEDRGGNFLLHFARAMTLPAELFHDLDAAKARAVTALRQFKGDAKGIGRD